MNSVEHLKQIFPDRSAQDLEMLLKRHGYQIEAVVEALIVSAEESSSPPNRNICLQPSSIAPTIVHLPPKTSSVTSDVRNTPTIVAQPSSTRFAPPPLVAPRTPKRKSFSADERRRNLQRARERALEIEEQQLNIALRESLAPSHRGVQYLSDEELSKLMNDPVFLASLDASDLREAATLQHKLEAAEAEWKTKFEHHSKGSNLSALSKVAAQQKRDIRSKLDTVLTRARSNFGMATTEEERLVQQLEAMNRENQEEQIRRKIRLEAKEAMLVAMREHLDSFLEENPDSSYEKWIEEIHPENAHDGLLLEGLDKTIDHRFYVEESEHLHMWNERCRGDRRRSPVSPRRPMQANVGPPIDLLSD